MATVLTSTATSISTTVPVGATTGTIAVTVSAQTATSATAFYVALSQAIMSNTLVQACEVQFLDPGGLSNYSNTQDFTQTFRPVNAGDVIRITFLSFSTESCCDNLAIYDGPTTASPLLQTLAGTALPGSFYSTTPGGELTFKFHSDGSIVATGWEAIISCIPPPPPPPTITGFSPLSGPIGTSITITGTNFSATPANNIVYFGAVRATATAATPTQLTVTVPAGTSYKAIRVNVAGLSGFSSKPFRVTFTGGPLTATSFSCPIGRSGQDVGDIDGDGRPDFAYVLDYFDDYASAVRNLNDPGAILLSNFESRVDYVAGHYMDHVRFVDFDGDGKLDLAAEGGMLRNTSTPGPFSFSTFASNVGFVPGTPAMDSEYGDMDGDGKVDAVFTEFINIDAVCIRRNVGLPGAISTGSFAPRVDFTVGTSFNQLVLEDVDQDGKLDMIVTGPVSGGTLAVFRNISSPGSITTGSFAPRVEFSTGGIPLSLAAADLDDDDRPEMIVANQTTQTISVFPNTSTPGAISFASPINLPVGSQPNSVTVGDLNGDAKLEIVVWKNPSITGIFKNIHVSGQVTAASFDARIDVTSMAGVIVHDIDGDGKPDIVGGATFRNMIGEPELAVSSITPLSGAIGTSVTIAGTEFDPVAASNIVRFNGLAATVTSASATSLVVTVPPGATTGSLTVTVSCKTVTGGTFTVGGVITVSSHPSNRIVCNGVTTTFTVSASGPGTLSYQWQLGGSDISNGAGYSGATDATLTVNTTGNFGAGNYRCRISSTSAPSVTSNTATLTINPTPTAPITTGAFSCAPAAITLTASGDSNGNYRWYTAASGGTAISGAVNGTYVTPVIPSSTTYHVSIANGTCESSRTPVLAEIKSCAPQIIPTTVTSSVGGTVTQDLVALITTVAGPLDINSLSVVVPPLSGAKATISAGSLTLDYAGIAFAGSDVLTVRACDLLANCANGDIAVSVAGEIVMYNAVSPNADGKNDAFFIEFIDLLPDTKENKVTIFNRWGSVVYEATNYSNTANPFRGQGKNGEELPSGTYYYIIEFSSGAPKRTGFISLRR
jgi:gliding motility-associated-like protein